MWFFSVFCFCHVMAWMVDCFSFYKLTPPKVTHSLGLDFWLFSMFSHLASPSLPPVFFVLFLVFWYFTPLWVEVSCDKCRNWVARLSKLVNIAPLFRGRCTGWTCLSPSPSIVCTSNRWRWLCVWGFLLFCFVFLAVKSSRARFSWVSAWILISSSLAGVDLWPTI